MKVIKCILMHEEIRLCKYMLDHPFVLSVIYSLWPPLTCPPPTLLLPAALSCFAGSLCHTFFLCILSQPEILERNPSQHDPRFPRAQSGAPGHPPILAQAHGSTKEWVFCSTRRGLGRHWRGSPESSRVVKYCRRRKPEGCVCHSEVLTQANLIWDWKMLNQIRQMECILPASLLLSQLAWLSQGSSRSSSGWRGNRSLSVCCFLGLGSHLCWSPVCLKQVKWRDWSQIYEQWIFPLCSDLPSQTSDWKVAWGTGTSSKGKWVKVKGVSSGPCEAWCDTLPTIEHLSLLTEIFMSTIFGAFLSWMVWDELLLFTFLCYAPVQWTPNAIIACGVPGELV